MSNDVIELTTEEVSRLREWISKMYPIGKSFKYLGRDFVVVEYTEYAVVCDYLGGDGIIYTRFFPQPQFPLLKAIYQ